MAPTLDILLRELTDEEGFKKAFIALQLFGFIGCVIILGTVTLSHTPRHPTWFSFIISWIISSFSYLLIFVIGQLENMRPPFGVCLAQAALIYSAPPLTAATTLALVTQIYFSICDMFSDQFRRNEKIWTAALLIIPYLLHVTMAIACLALGLNDRGTVGRTVDSTYCNLKNRIPSKVSSITVASLMVPTVIIEIYICVMLHMNWKVLKRRKRSPSTALRVVVFSSFGILGIALGIIFAESNHGHGPELNMILAMMPAAAVLIFGAHSDILSVWMFWRKSDPPKAGLDTVGLAFITVPRAHSQVIDSQTMLRSCSPSSS